MRSDGAWLQQAWRSRGHVVVLDGALNAPVQDGGGCLRLVWQQASGDAPPPDAVLLGADETGAYWAVDDPGLVARGDEPRRAGLREVGQQLSDRDAGLLTHAVAVLTWHRSHSHCPRCGAATRSTQSGAVRVCERDASEHFPRVDPAMIVLVRSPDGERAVLGRAPSWPERFYSCLAGFVEPGESAEQAVVREVAEEVGLAVREVHYAGSQPWPFPSSLMLAFSAVADVAPVRPQPGELAAADWFTREQLRAGLASGELGLPPEVSIARGLIDDWLER